MQVLVSLISGHELLSDPTTSHPSLFVVLLANSNESFKHFQVSTHIIWASALKYLPASAMLHFSGTIVIEAIVLDLYAILRI